VQRRRIRDGRLRIGLAPASAKWLVLDGPPGAASPATLTAVR
jgi:hypothetical protein